LPHYTKGLYALHEAGSRKNIASSSAWSKYLCTWWI